MHAGRQKGMTALSCNVVCRHYNSKVEEKKEAELCLDEKCRARKQPSSKSSEGEIEGGFMKCRAWRQISSEGG